KPVEVLKKPAEEIVTKPVEVLKKPAEEVVAKTVEVLKKPAEEVVTKPVEVLQKPAEEIVTKPVEVLQKPAEEIVTKPVEVLQKPAEEIVTKPVEVLKKPAEEVVAKTVEVLQKPAEEVVAKLVEIPPKPAKAIVFKPVEVPQKTVDEIVSKPIEVIPKPANEIITSKPEWALTLIPLNIPQTRKSAPVPERKSLQEQTANTKPPEQSNTGEVFTLKKIQKTQPKLKTEMEIAEKLALNSIPGRTNWNQSQSEELPELTELAEITDDEEPIGFATTRKIPPVTVLREVSNTVNEFLKPKENFGKHPIFSLDSSSQNNFQEENTLLENSLQENTLQNQDEETGFARSSKYSKKPQQNYSPNTSQ
ncbi:MAG: hypothetical protein LBP87_10965, partial [Planctomycetaceae bacterium]|nr:hypothetical protein [Planctomycetaceae bacterium]